MRGFGESNWGVGSVFLFLGLLIGLPNQDVFALDCRGILRTIHQMVETDGAGGQRADIRKLLTREEQAELRAEFKKRTSPYESIFKDLLFENGLKVSHENEEGIPVLESFEHPENASSAGVLASLNSHRMNFRSNEWEYPGDDYEDLARTLEHPEIHSALRFRSSHPGYELFFKLNPYGLVIGIRERLTGRVVIAGVPEGGEAYSTAVIDFLLNSLMRLN